MVFSVRHFVTYARLQVVLTYWGCVITRGQYEVYKLSKKMFDCGK